LEVLVGTEDNETTMESGLAREENASWESLSPLRKEGGVTKAQEQRERAEGLDAPGTRCIVCSPSGSVNGVGSIAAAKLVDKRLCSAIGQAMAVNQDMQAPEVVGTQERSAKGQVVTPEAVVRLMVEKLFRHQGPRPDDRLLDPGCGSGAFIKGVLDWCTDRGTDPPWILGVELDGKLLDRARSALGSEPKVKVAGGDFLLEDFGEFDHVICNPPYVRLEGLSERERGLYRGRLDTASKRFDLYMLFFEKALRCLAPGGRLVFITPEKFEYTVTARSLRRMLARCHVEEVHHIGEEAFPGLVTYPAITTVNKRARDSTRFVRRDGSSGTAVLPEDGSPWTPLLNGWSGRAGDGLTLVDVCIRVSCGVATGADRVFVIPAERVPKELEQYVRPTVSGRQLTPDGVQVSEVMVMPYDESGALLPEAELGPYLRWVLAYKQTLRGRYCVRRGGREWYAFHERPPLVDLLQPKILCKDIAREPRFWADRTGELVPRHSVYYIVPASATRLDELLECLNGRQAREWLMAHAQRAANGFVRLQSGVLKRIPLEGGEERWS
jgi:adenine-specific DNA-methyltransferase